MEIIKVVKADPITNDEPVHGVIIEISEQVPTDFNNLTEIEMFYKKQAKELHNAMKENMPQGLRYQLLLLMLEDAPNLYKGNK